MSERVKNQPSKIERTVRTLRKPVLGAMGALAFLAGTAGVAEAKTPRAATPHAQEAPAINGPLVINPAAVLQSHLAHKQFVTFDAFQAINWGPNEASETTVPLTANVDGHTDYFSVTQTNPKHGTLRTLRVTELQGLAADALVPAIFPDVPAGSQTTTWQSGVVILDSNRQPEIRVPGVTMNNGKPLYASVGQTIPNPHPSQ